MLPNSHTAPDASPLEKSNINCTKPRKSPVRDPSHVEKCAICLCTPENRSYTDSCYHEFCFVCLLEWSKVKSECPLCKQKFKNIIHNIRSISDFDEFEVRHETASDARATASRVSTDLNSNLFGYDEHGNRFRYNSTMTAERMELIRRMIYERGLRVRPLQESQLSSNDDSIYIVSYRDTSPEFYRENPAQMHRLLRWLNRELNVFFNGRVERISFVCEFISHLLTRYEIRSEEFRRRLSVVLSESTDHFLHEFYHFARSPLEMDEYDRHITYSRSITDTNEHNGRPPPEPITLDDHGEETTSNRSSVIGVPSSGIAVRLGTPSVSTPECLSRRTSIVVEGLADLRRSVQNTRARINCLQRGLEGASLRENAFNTASERIHASGYNNRRLSAASAGVSSAIGCYARSSTFDFEELMSGCLHNSSVVRSSSEEGGLLCNTHRRHRLRSLVTRSASDFVDEMDNPLNLTDAPSSDRIIVQTNSTTSPYSVHSETISTHSSVDDAASIASLNLDRVTDASSPSSDHADMSVLLENDCASSSRTFYPHSLMTSLDDSATSLEDRKRSSEHNTVDDTDVQIIAELKPKRFRTPEVLYVPSSDENENSDESFKTSRKIWKDGQDRRREDCSDFGSNQQPCFSKDAIGSRREQGSERTHKKRDEKPGKEWRCRNRRRYSRSSESSSDGTSRLGHPIIRSVVVDCRGVLKASHGHRCPSVRKLECPHQTICVPEESSSIRVKDGVRHNHQHFNRQTERSDAKRSDANLSSGSKNNRSVKRRHQET